MGAWFTEALITKRRASVPSRRRVSRPSFHPARRRSTSLADLATFGRELSRASLWARLATAAALVIGMAFGTRAIGGSDSYGYVSQADLWLKGSLTVEQPFVGDLPWENASLTMTPLGYIPTSRAGTFVPMYPPGFPLTVALFKLIGGEWALYLAVPLLAAAAVWLTFQLGRALYNEWAGAIAAVLLVTSPAFVFMLVSAPMSDIPATAWWLLAIVAAIGHRTAEGERRTSHAIVSGLAASIAILTRPNLAPLAIMPLVLMFLTSPGRRVGPWALSVWLGSALIGPVALAVFNARLYGSPISSGYGQPIVSEFSLSNIVPNLSRYTGWLMQVETPFVLAGLLAPFLVRRAGDRASVSVSWWCLAFSAMVLAAYLSYTVFGAWWYLRFLLPGYPTMLVTAAAAILILSRNLGRLRIAIPALLTASIAWHGLAFAKGQGAFSLADGEGRYKEAGELAKRFPRNAVALSFQHSGSLRYYAGVTTMRFDTMPAEWLDKAIDYLEGEGRPVYAVLDDWEVELIRERFSMSSPLRWLAADPAEISRHGVRVYEIAKARKQNGRPG